MVQFNVPSFRKICDCTHEAGIMEHCFIHSYSPTQVCDYRYIHYRFRIPTALDRPHPPVCLNISHMTPIWEGGVSDTAWKGCVKGSFFSNSHMPNRGTSGHHGIGRVTEMPFVRVEHCKFPQSPPPLLKYLLVGLYTYRCYWVRLSALDFIVTFQSLQTWHQSGKKVF